MTRRGRVLAALEVGCFAAICGGLAVAGYALGGELVALATGLTTAGAVGVYLVNVYSLPNSAEAEPDD